MLDSPTRLAEIEQFLDEKNPDVLFTSALVRAKGMIRELLAAMREAQKALRKQHHGHEKNTTGGVPCPTCDMEIERDTLQRRVEALEGILDEARAIPRIFDVLRREVTHKGVDGREDFVAVQILAALRGEESGWKRPRVKS